MAPPPALPPPPPALSPRRGGSGERAPTTLDLGVGGLLGAQLIVLAVSVPIALFYAIVLSKPFLVCLVYSEAIGNSMFWLNWALHRVRRLPALCWRTTAVALGLGGVAGIALGRLFEVRRLDRALLEPGILGPPLAGAFVFGAITAYYFHARAVVAEGRARLREEMLQRAEREQRLTEAELKLLQAQIEPHFLFNTLSNVLHLVDADPPGAKRMLANLTSYLRASLHRTRAGATTLGEELDLVRAYLEIQTERMGARLAYRIDCPAELRGLSLPPLLVQPLVENAVRHGLEPRPGGGEVRVRAGREEGALLLEVRDDGAGISDQGRSGVGLANVRARVRAVSQGRGSMVIQAVEPHGLSVRIALPLPGDRLAAGGSAG
jgi:signal transduction histidine kinase